MFARTFYLKALLAITLIAIPSITEAAYNWSTVSPTSGGTGSASSQPFSATIEWGTNDAPITSIGAYTVINVGWTNIIDTKTTSNITGNKATVTGTVTFDPALNSGDQYTIVIMASTGTSFYSTSIVLTVP